MSDLGNFIINLNSNLNEMGKFVRSVFQKTTELSNAFKAVLPKILESLQKIPEYSRKILLLLAKNGWYIAPEMPVDDVLKVAGSFAVNNNNIAQANDLLCNYFNSSLNDIEQSLCKKYPERTKLLQDAFWAHRNEKYALSIPVFLAQAEGIFYRITGEKLYSKKKGKPKFVSSAYYKDLDNFSKTFLAPIIEPGMPISANENERKKIKLSSFILNRHTVLHGESIDYDTQINSCKAISFLTYIDWMFTDVINKATQNKSESVRCGVVS